MPIINRFADLHDEIAGWRRDYHRHPELLYDVHRTAADVAQKLRAFGCDEVVEGIGRTGVVGVREGRGRRALRPRHRAARRHGRAADPEESGKPWASETPGKMHACGHDGHTAMLLGAARYLSETRRFSGTAVFIFQPAEEGGAGGRAMVEDGMMDRFGIEEVYGMHNMPGLPLGHFAIRPGALMAATDQFIIEIEGHGGARRASPHATIDPIVTGAAIVQALQSIVSRNVDPLQSAVVSVTTFNAGDTFNVIPQRAKITGTGRSLDPLVRDLIERRMREVVQNVAAAYGATAKFTLRAQLSGHGEPPRADGEGDRRSRATWRARRTSTPTHPPVMGGEDFSYMLEARPGAFIFIGNGDTAGLHHPAYDFNDAAIDYGSCYWARLVERLMPAA